MLALSDSLANVIAPTTLTPTLSPWERELSEVLQYADAHFYPELLDWLTDEISNLLEEGMEPAEIVVLAPYLSDALRFSLMHRLETRGIPVRSHRPSRSLRDEPATQSLLTLAALAHPQWGIQR